MDASQLVKDVQSLIDRYGIAVVQATVNFVGQLPTDVHRKFSADGEVAMLTQAQQDRLWRIANSNHTNESGYVVGGKIQAIRALREMSGIGLRAAKDIVEAHFVKEGK